MSEHILDVTTVTFSGPRFEDAGLELDVLPELLAYRKLLIETAKELWRAENPDRQRLPKGFGESIRLKFYSIEKGSAGVPIKRVVERDDMSLFASLDVPDEIDEAAQLIDNAIEAAALDVPFPEKMPKSVLPLLAEFGATMGENELIKTQAARSPRAVELTPAVRERVSRLIEAVYEDRVEITGEVRAADVDQRNFAIRDAAGRKIPAKFRPEDEVEITEALRDHESCRVDLHGAGEYSNRDGSLRRIIRVDSLRRRPAGDEVSDTGSATPIWEVLAALGEGVPGEEWDRIPSDLSTTLDQYLYDRVADKE